MRERGLFLALVCLCLLLLTYYLSSATVTLGYEERKEFELLPQKGYKGVRVFYFVVALN